MEKNQEKQPGEQYKEKKDPSTGSGSSSEGTPSLEEAIEQVRQGMKEPILQGIKRGLEELETLHYVNKVPEEEYAKRKKELLEGQEKVKNDKLNVASLAVLIQFDDRGPVHYYAGALKAGEEVFCGATTPELYNMACTIKFMVENQTMNGIVHNQLEGQSAQLTKSLSKFLRDFMQGNRIDVVRTPMDRFPGSGGRR